MTKHTTIFVPVLCALALSGCTGAFVGNIFVVFVAVGIFIGTLGLGRTTPSASSTASRTDPVTDSRA